MTAIERLTRSFQVSGLFEPVDSAESEDGTQVFLLGRVRKENRPGWDRFLVAMLTAEGEMKDLWRSHVCQRYLLRDGALIYGWHLSISSSQMSEALDVIVPYLNRASAPRSRTESAPAPAVPASNPLRRVTHGVLDSGEPYEIVTTPLAGATKERVPNELGKGGYLVGSKSASKNFRPPVRR